MATESKEEQLAAAPSAAVDDDLQEKLHGCFLGTVLIDVREVTTAWPDGRNRELDRGLVAELINSFRNGIRRLAAENRIKVSVTMEQWEALTLALAQYEATDWETLGEDDQKREHQDLKEVLREAISFVRFDDFHKLIKLQDVPVILEGGQHRCKALIQCNEEVEAFRKSLKDPEMAEEVDKITESSYLWAADVYNSDAMSPPVRAVLRQNRADARKVNSPGIMYCQAVKLMGAKIRANNIKRKDIVKNLQQVVGLGTSGCNRAANVVAAGAYHNVFYRYTQTPYGQRMFEWSTAEKIVLSRLDWIWIPELEQFNHFCKTVFPSHWQSVPSEDLRLIFTVFGNKRARDLELLFFPSLKDIKNNALKGILQLPMDYMKEQKSLPRMTAYKGHETRRPDFLVGLPIQAYGEAWDTLVEAVDGKITLACPSWDHWAKLAKTVSERLKKYLQHVCFWYSPAWTYPTGAAGEAKTFYWPSQLRLCMFGTPIEGSGKDDDREQEEQQLTAVKNMVKDLWDQVRDSPGFNDDQLRTTVNDPAIDKRTMFVPLEEKLNEDEEALASIYWKRFEYLHWGEFLLICFLVSGGMFKGIMAKFNDSKVIADNVDGYNTWGILIENMTFRDNKMVKDIPCLNKKSDRASLRAKGEIFGLLWEYTTIKRKAVYTIDHGYPDVQARAKGAENHIMEEDWEKTMQHLIGVHSNLTNRGVQLDFENLNENLDRLLTLTPTLADKDKPDAPPDMRFGKVKPKRRVRKSIGRKLLGKRKRADADQDSDNESDLTEMESVEDEDEDGPGDEHHAAETAGQGQNENGTGNGTGGQGAAPQSGQGSEDVAANRAGQTPRRKPAAKPAAKPATKPSTPRATQDKGKGSKKTTGRGSGGSSGRGQGNQGRKK